MDMNQSAVVALKPQAERLSAPNPERFSGPERRHDRRQMVQRRRLFVDLDRVGQAADDRNVCTRRASRQEGDEQERRETERRETSWISSRLLHRRVPFPFQHRFPFQTRVHHAF
jgi:hypothetical protein